MLNEKRIISLIKDSKLGRNDIMMVTGCTAHEYTMILHKYIDNVRSEYVKSSDDKVNKIDLDKNEMNGYGESFKKLLINFDKTETIGINTL